MESFKVGEAPWEQENPTEFKVGEAPWEQAPEKIVNEMHPDIPFTVRAVYKNFGADPEASFNYLQKKLPNLQLKKDKEGEILAKRSDELEWRRLDPKGFDLQDISDIGYDVPAAVAQGAATAAVGLAGGAAGGGVGAIPAAMVTSGVTGAGLEGLRQGIGSWLGIEDNASKEQAILAGAAGTVSPLLFGTGAGAKEAGKYIAKKGLETTSKDLLQTQRGLLGRGYDAAAGYVGPKLGTFVSGENPEVIKKAAGMLKEIKAADTNPEVTTLPLTEAANTINSELKKLSTETGRKLEDLRGMIDNQPGLILTGEGAATQRTGSIPAAEFIQPFRDLAEKLSAGGAATEAQLKDAQTLARVIEQEFKGLPDNLTAAQVDTLRKRFKERAQQYGLNYGKVGQAVGGTEGASAIDAQIALAFEDSRRKMNDSIISRLEAMGPEYANEYKGLNDAYSRIKTVQKEISPKTKNSKSLSQFLTSATKDPHAEKQMMDVVELTGLDLPELAYRDQALKVFSKPNTAVRSLGGTTSTSRTIPLSTAGGAAGYYLGQQNNWSPFLTSAIMSTLGATAGSPAAMRKYMQANQLLRRTIPTEGLGLPYSQELLRSTPYLMMNANLHDQGEK